MLRAVEMSTGKMTSPGAPGLVGAGTWTCSECDSTVHRRFPSKRQPHFVHDSLSADCPGYGPTTAWHLEWQELAPVKRREVWHAPRRADVETRTGQVVEIQHSPLDPAIALARTADHYARTGKPVVWVLDAGTYRLAIDPARKPLQRRETAHKGGVRVPSATAWVTPLPPLVEALLHCGEARVWIDQVEKGHVLHLGSWWPAVPDRIRSVTYKKIPRDQAQAELAAECADLAAA